MNLIEAAKRGDVTLIENLSRESDFNPNIRDESSYTPLMWACHFGHLDAVKVLIEKKADVNLIDNNGSTCIHFGAESGKIEILKLFANNELDFNRPNEKGLTPLHYAAITADNTEILSYLISKQTNINLKAKNGFTALIFAIIHNKNSAIATFLIDQGADVNTKTNDGGTPLHYAVEQVNISIISALLEKCALIDEKNTYGNTPIMIALKNNYTAIVELLLKGGSHLDVKSYSIYRMCSNILNMPIFDSINQDTSHFSNGGTFVEARNTIKCFLQQFIAERRLNKTDFMHILAGLDTLGIEEMPFAQILEHLSTGNTFFSKTGCFKHQIYFSVKQKLTGYELAFAERGLFAKISDRKVQPFFTLSATESTLEPILSFLFKARKEGQDVAKKIIFENIPQLTGETYYYPLIRKKPFKQGHCYFENLKSLINYELIKTFGEKYGEKLYKEFTLFMEMNALSILKSQNFANKENIINAIQTLIYRKISQLDSEEHGQLTAKMKPL